MRQIFKCDVKVSVPGFAGKQSGAQDRHRHKKPESHIQRIAREKAAEKVRWRRQNRATSKSPLQFTLDQWPANLHSKSQA